MNLALIVLITVFILIFLLRMPISLGMIAAGTYYFMVKGTSLGAVANHVMNTYYSNYVIIAVPLLLIPIATMLGIDLIHFGLVVTLNMMIGLSTPPFGMLLFITAGISDTPLKDVMREIKWPILAMIAVLLIITFIPETVLFLPRTFGMI